MFKKFFGKKNDGFFLQLENEDATSKPNAKAAKALTKDAVAAPDSKAAATPAKVVATATKKAESAPTAKAEKKAATKVNNPETKVAPAPAPIVSTPPAPAITNFATDYLIRPTTNSDRRLPGANMRGFLELARQVDKPKNFKNPVPETKPSEK